MKKIKRFELRMNNSLYTLLSRKAKKLKISKYTIIENALFEAINAYSGGKIFSKIKSNFLTRVNKNDFIRYEILLSLDQKEVLKKLAFTMHLSMAESLRRILEYYFLEKDKSKAEKTLEINRNTGYSINPILVLYEVTRPIEHRYFMFGHPPNYKVDFSA